MIDIKKVITTPQNEWQAIDAMIKAEQHLLSALHILESIIENNGEEYRELHEKRIKEFLLPIYESRHQNNKAPRKAIEAVKKYIKGEIGLDEFLTARHAAYAAYADAAYAAAAAYAAYDDAADAAYAAAYAAAAYAAAA